MTEQRHRIIEITCKLQKISLHSSPLGLQMGRRERGRSEIKKQGSIITLKIFCFQRNITFAAQVSELDAGSNQHVKESLSGGLVGGI